MDILTAKGKTILMGNEAIVRGALESGVQFASTYPGTPASEIGNTFYQIAKDAGVYFEFSTNEKIALEAGIGANFANLKTLVAMKNFGLNVASDALFPFLYTGCKAGFVLIVADDPSCWSSAESEQNTRAYSYMAHIPTLEPSNPKECYEFTKLAFELSAKFSLPFMIRLTTRVAHQKMPIKVGLIKKINSKGKFIKNKHKFITMPPRVLEMKQELLEKIETIQQLANQSPLNKIEKAKGRVGVIASGVSYLYVKEALAILNLNLPVLKIGIFYPLASDKVKNFIKPLNKVLVVEELEGFLEKEVTALAKKANCKLQVFGKDLLPQVGELNTDLALKAIAKVANKKYQPLKQANIEGVKHLPRFCTGFPTCPYWKLFAAVKQAVPKSAIFGGDIGCYMMAALPPHNLYDYLLCMGSSLGIAHGIKKANPKQKVVAFMGDGTFFHSGVGSVLNAVYNKSNPLFIILDNRITAMTGHQPNPGSEVKIENIVKAIGVKNVKVIDQEEDYDLLIKTIKGFLNKPEISVIVARHICGLLAKKKAK